MGEISPSSRRGFKVVVVQEVQEGLGHLGYGLEFSRVEVVVLVENQRKHCLGDAGRLEGRISKRTPDDRLLAREDALAQQAEEVEVHLLGVLVLDALHGHEQILHVYDGAQQLVHAGARNVVQVRNVHP